MKQPQKLDAPRVRLSADIDLSTAKNHERCHGTGIVGYKQPTESEIVGGQVEPIPIVCRCVSRRGGVKKDAFDRMGDELQQQLADGSFAETLAFDVRSLPADAKAIKLEELRATVKSDDTDKNVKAQIKIALSKI